MTEHGHNGGPPLVDDDVPDMAYVKFFPGDFLNGTAHLSLEMTGAYIRTLCVMYDRMGGFPYDDDRGATLLRVDRRVYRRIRDQLIADGKFFRDGDVIRNARVESEITDYVREYRRRRAAALEREEAKRRAAAERAEAARKASIGPATDAATHDDPLAPETRLHSTSGGSPAEVRPKFETSPAEVPGKSGELETKNSTNTTEPRAQDDHIPESRSQKPEARSKNKKDIYSSTSDEMPEQPETPLAGRAVDRRAINRAAAQHGFRLWQDTARRLGLPVPRDTTFATFGQKIAARMHEHAEPPRGVSEMVAAWQHALSQVERSAFLRGQTSAGFRADLKFLCQRESFAKLIDGGYGNGAHAPAARNDFTAIVGREALAHGPLRIRDGDGDLLAEPAQQRRRNP